MNLSDSTSPHYIHERAPSLMPWGQLAPQVVRLIQADSRLANRILCAPTQWVHSVAICLLRTADATAEDIASVIYDVHPRDLLSICWADANPLLFRSLKKCPNKVFAIQTYEQLNTLLNFGASEVLLKQKKLDLKKIEFLFEARSLDPVVTAACDLLDYRMSRAKHFDAMLKLMRKMNLIGDVAHETNHLRQTEYHSVTEYVEHRLARVKSPVDLNLLKPLVQIKTGEELSSIAVKWRNCLKSTSYRAALGSGSKVFVLLLDDDSEEHVALASFERTTTAWQMDECATPERRFAPPEIRQHMCKLLGENGIIAEPLTFHRALSELSMHCEDGIRNFPSN
jgi:hypothetical protein